MGVPVNVSGQQTRRALAHVAGDVGWLYVQHCNANGYRYFYSKGAETRSAGLSKSDEFRCIQECRYA